MHVPYAFLAGEMLPVYVSSLSLVLDNKVEEVRKLSSLEEDCYEFAMTEEMIEALGKRSITESFPLACKMGFTSLVSTMLSKGADPTYKNFSGLMFASEQGHDEIVKLILGHIDPTSFRTEINEAYNRAAKYERDECMVLLKI